MLQQHGIGALRGAIAAALAFASLTIGPGAWAAERDGHSIVAAADQSAANETQSPSELAREGMAKMLQALNRLVESVPQFEMPEMNENGDIILRRKHPPLPAPVPVPGPATYNGAPI
jgi:hypothetical protein